MKKFFRLIILCLLLFSFLIPYTAFAETEAEWQDIELTEEEFDSLLENNPNNGISTHASGLITLYSIAVSQSGSNLVVGGRTNCITDVKKCGFTKVTIQVRFNSTAPWSTYKEYTDLYADRSSYILSKTIAAPTGQYRVTCTHYAKKSLLSTEKINNTSNTVTIKL
ncbi:MAG: hypothetical protein K2F65_04700 [Eubacterium sp.]|nr:hypothetical protein [Eubacterium sp.]